MIPNGNVPGHLNQSANSSLKISCKNYGRNKFYDCYIFVDFLDK